MSAPTAARFGRFGERTGEPASMRHVRRLSIGIVALFCVIAPISGYRAIVQVYRLELRVASDTVRAGAVVGVRMASSARTFTHMRLLLVQGPREETLMVKRVPGNEIRFGGAALSPWPRKDSGFVMVSPDLLGRFGVGSATLRAVGTGASQWMRVPPPTVRERVVTLAR